MARELQGSRAISLPLHRRNPMALYRVRPDRAAMVRHPDTGEMCVPSLVEPYEADDPLVRRYPDMFATDEQLAKERADKPVEQATAAPGEKRATRR